MPEVVDLTASSSDEDAPLPMNADRTLLGHVAHLSCGEKVKNAQGARKPRCDVLRVTKTGCETTDGRKDVNKWRKHEKKSGDTVGSERHRRALSLLCTAVGEGFGDLVEDSFGGDNVTWRGVDGANSLSLASGVWLAIGGVKCVVTKYNEPCANLTSLWKRLAAEEALWPGWPRLPNKGGKLTHAITARNGPLGQNTAPGQRGWFARVVEEGEIRVGDELFQVAAPASRFLRYARQPSPDGPPARKKRKM